MFCRFHRPSRPGAGAAFQVTCDGVPVALRFGDTLVGRAHDLFNRTRRAEERHAADAGAAGRPSVVRDRRARRRSLSSTMRAEAGRSLRQQRAMNSSRPRRARTRWPAGRRAARAAAERTRSSPTRSRGPHRTAERMLVRRAARFSAPPARGTRARYARRSDRPRGRGGARGPVTAASAMIARSDRRSRQGEQDDREAFAKHAEKLRPSRGLTASAKDILY